MDRQLTPDEKWELISRDISRGTPDVPESDHIIGESEVRAATLPDRHSVL